MTSFCFVSTSRGSHFMTELLASLAASVEAAGHSVELRLDGETIRPNQSGQHFDVPDVFKKPAKQWRDDQLVDITLSCGGRTVVFPKLHPAFIRAGDWELGIAHPPYSIERFRRTPALEHGAWISYLIFEGEPGVVTFVSQPDPPLK